MIALLCATLAGCAAGDTGTDEWSEDLESESSESESSESSENVSEDAQAISSPANMNLFTAPNPWTKNVSALTKSSKSDAIISWLSNAGGWGGGKMRIDFGMTILEATSSTPKKSFVKTDEFYSPDCDHVPFPVPSGGSLEGENGYACNNDGDCHLIVVNKSENKLYEMWRAHMSGSSFYGGCAAVWDLAKTYPTNLRGEGCTSADAGGFPIAAMVFTPSEIKAGAINHAIRFILPNSRIRDNVYVHPGTHTTNPTSGGPNAPPYGVRFRLKKSYPINNLSSGAKVIAKAMQTYGMFLSDGGTIALSAATDKYSSVKWSQVGVNSYSLQALKVSDFEVVDMGTPISWNGYCKRN
jgi:hypothetical protein